MKESVRAVILAAGKGTRLKSERPKVLQGLFGKPLLGRVLETLDRVDVEEACVIVGHGRSEVIAMLEAEADQKRDPERAANQKPVGTVVQEPQLGTGHAMQQVRLQRPDWEDYDGSVLILSGDVPLLEADTLRTLIDAHRSEGDDLTLLAATLDNSFGYGRVISEGRGVLRVVEEKDATDEERRISTINTGIYCMRWRTIAPLLEKLSNGNQQGEFYLTDVVALAVQAGLQVGLAHLKDPDEALGVNTHEDLARCHTVLNDRTLRRLMAAGVCIPHPASTLVAPEVSIEPDTTLLPGCYLQGNIRIGRRCMIGPYTTMSGSVDIGDEVTITHSVIRDSRIGSFTHIGPFAQLRDGVELGHHVHIGNFVEIKKTRIDHHTNAAHLAYLGDAMLGSDVNIGAGTITANYDPVRDLKQQTTIENGAKVGSNSVLVAPVTVGENASVAAGSVITQDVSPWDLAIARGRQTAIPGWVKRAKGLTEKV